MGLLDFLKNKNDQVKTEKNEKVRTTAPKKAAKPSMDCCMLGDDSCCGPEKKYKKQF